MIKYSGMSNLSKDQVKAIIVRTLRPLGVERIALFGSYSRGDLGSSSDIDILVRLGEGKNSTLIGLRWFSLDIDLEQLLGRKVDLISENSLDPTLKILIERDLEVIYEKAG